MRGSISKKIDNLVDTKEVLTLKEIEAEYKPDIRRRKKKFWNKISHIEKTKRTLKLKKEGN